MQSHTLKKSFKSGIYCLKPQRITFTWRSPLYGERHRTYVDKNDILVEQELLRNIHPEKLHVESNYGDCVIFHLTRLASTMTVSMPF